MKTDDSLEGSLDRTRDLFVAHEIIGILKLAKSQKLLVSYVDLAKALGMFSGGTELAKQLGLVMELVEGTEYDMLPAIVSRREGDVAIGPG